MDDGKAFFAVLSGRGDHALWLLLDRFQRTATTVVPFADALAGGIFRRTGGLGVPPPSEIAGAMTVR
jgi:hypothetical protein